MLLNYFKVAFRNLTKQGFYALINIVGLAVGVACCAMIVLYVQDELSYDQHHERAGDIYRVSADIAFGQMDDKIAVVSAPMAEALVNDYPEVIKAGRFRSRGTYLIRPAGSDVDNIKEAAIQFADPSIFEIFTIPTIQGDPVEGLKQPNTVVISASKAEKYFPGESAIGKSLTLDNSVDYKVVAVVEDIPENSHFEVDFFLSMETLDESKQPIWVSHNFHTYIQLAPDADPAALEAKFPDMVRKYVGPQVEQFMQVNLDQFEEKGGRMAYFLQPLKDIYLHSDLVAEIGPVGDMTYVWLFGAIA
ncbi:MAG: ABC transporter permease, partial [Bacteroidota bacterium]